MQDRERVAARRTGRLTRIGLLLLAGALCAGSGACLRPSAAPPPGRILETPAFTIVSQLADGADEGLGFDADVARAAVGHLLAEPLADATAPVTIHLVGADRPVWQHSSTRDAHFAVAASPEGLVYVVDGRRNAHGQRTGLEQAIAHSALQRSAIRYPQWYAIGLGAVLETLDVRRDSVVFGLLDLDRLRRLRTTTRYDVESVLRPERYAALDPSMRRMADATAWLMVHYLTFELHEQPTAAPGTRFRHYTEAIAEGLDPVAALELAWGLTATQLEHEVTALASGRLRSWTLAFDTLGLDRATSRPLRALPPAARSRHEGDRALAFGELDAARAAYEAALVQSPFDPEATLGLARLEARTGALERALAQADRAVSLAPGSAPAWATRARIRLETLPASSHPERAEQLASAREDLAFARALDGDDPLVLWLAARASLEASPRDPGETLALLERAHDRLPADRTIRLALLEACRENGRLRCGRRVAASLRSDARDAADLRELEARTAWIQAARARASSARSSTSP